MGAVRITSWYPHFNGSHFGSPPSSIHRMTGLGDKMLWIVTYAHRPQWQYTKDSTQQVGHYKWLKWTWSIQLHKPGWMNLQDFFFAMIFCLARKIPPWNHSNYQLSRGFFCKPQNFGSRSDFEHFVRILSSWTLSAPENCGRGNKCLSPSSLNKIIVIEKFAHTDVQFICYINKNVHFKQVLQIMPNPSRTFSLFFFSCQFFSFIRPKWPRVCVCVCVCVW